MKRNKCTETMGHEDLTPLTEHVLAQMGSEGADIRQRLKKFYRRRVIDKVPYFHENLDESP